MIADEQYVRDRWAHTISGGLWLYEAARSYNLRLGPREIKGYVKDKDAVWSAARKFTEDREEQIRLVEEEIEMLENEDRHDDYPPFLRILGRAKAALDELRKGMKEPIRNDSGIGRN